MCLFIKIEIISLLKFRENIKITIYLSYQLQFTINVDARDNNELSLFFDRFLRALYVYISRLKYHVAIK